MRKSSREVVDNVSEQFAAAFGGLWQAIHYLIACDVPISELPSLNQKDAKSLTEAIHEVFGALEIVFVLVVYFQPMVGMKT